MLKCLGLWKVTLAQCTSLKEGEYKVEEVDAMTKKADLKPR